MKAKVQTALILAGLFLPSACGKVYNSSSYDALIYKTVDGTPQFLEAKKVIDTHCAVCHTRPSHQAWAGMNEADFINQNYIVAGSLEDSILYTKIQGNRTTTAGNMPETGSPLNSTELDTLEAWILNITP